jgi:hypothetical protein
VREDDEGPHYALFYYSVAIIVTSVLAGLGFAYALVVSKFLMPTTGIYVLDLIKDDQYYCYFLPLCLIPTYLFFYLNWLSWTYFQYN